MFLEKRLRPVVASERKVIFNYEDFLKQFQREIKKLYIYPNIETSFNKEFGIIIKSLERKLENDFDKNTPEKVSDVYSFTLNEIMKLFIDLKLPKQLFEFLCLKVIQELELERDEFELNSRLTDARSAIDHLLI